MKHSLVGGLTVAVALSVFGAPIPSYAQSAVDGEVSQHTQPESLQTSPEILGHTPSDSDEPDLFPSPSALPTQATAANSTAPPPAARGELESGLATILPHALDNRSAATIYLRSIPVVTLIGGDWAAASGTKSVADTAAAPSPAADPVARASALVARLSELAATSDPAEIVARWDGPSRTYVVSWAEEDLITVNSRTILPDTTRNEAEDTLQMANRLRRLLGNAPALAAIEGMPVPAAPQRVGIVTSTLTGMASWYGPGFHGRRSASGEVFNQNALTAAHRTLPFGTQVRVTNLNTGQQVVVRINDRGPFGHGRIIDLSAAAASSIGLMASGVGRVQLEVLSAP
ncbi:MAG TPA: septal ring lytic transglycosylase RlpA family protein [Leptolyngbyaceae cyanobacterium M65_K2018_010]|nr:septal ring lytic transglycosylase RlpA family protein [Leptolyngbyaceae cyanobacterium M65_K2018_010]